MLKLVCCACAVLALAVLMPAGSLPAATGDLAVRANRTGETGAMTEAEILDGTDTRIERHRKADAVAGVRVHVEQTRHAFLFGCNAFPVLGYDDPEREATYQREFAALFNYATLGFYWGAYEAQEGKTIASHLERQARWCRDNDIAVKGHPLVWHEVYPRWGPSDPDETRAKLRARVTDIVSRFAALIDRWDVVNEATVSAQTDNGIGNWAKRDGAAALVGEALAWARAAGPAAFLLYNDYNLGEDYEQLARDLLAANAPVDAFGIQSHMHAGEWPITKAWEACETYARFGRPLHFTETTVLSGEHGWQRPRPWPSTPEGEALQAEYVAKFYTVLFSHPAVEAITWWDFMDGGWQAAPAGLVRADLTPKPAYQRLLELIKGRWWTREDATTAADGTARFRGYLGRYRITVAAASGETVQEMDLRPSEDNVATVAVK
jgi:endo-1,4-beta-xylanase